MNSSSYIAAASSIFRSTQMKKFDRRDFIKTTVLGGAAALTASTLPHAGIAGQRAASGAVKPIAISSGNGAKALEKTMEMILKGSDALDAAIAGVNIVEDDPND